MFTTAVETHHPCWTVFLCMPNLITSVTKIDRSPDHFIMVESPCTTSFLSTQHPLLQVGFKTRIPNHFLVVRDWGRRAAILCYVTPLVAANTDLLIFDVVIYYPSR